MEATRFLIVGGGPVGFAAALLLAKDGHQCVVYEARGDIPNNPEESYPIGINPRTLQTLESINPALAQTGRDTGRIVDAWQIFAGPRMVADLRSGVVYGTSRGKVNTFLYEEALTNPNIEICFNHKLVDVGFDSKELFFDVRGEDGAKIRTVVAAGGARIIASDGLYSKVRRCIETKLDGFESKVTPWTNEFRVLFAKPGDTREELDTKIHYIFSGFYSATLDNGGQQQWSCVMGARDSAPASERELLLSNDPSPANIAKLRAFVKSRAPDVEPLFDDAEMVSDNACSYA